MKQAARVLLATAALTMGLTTSAMAAEPQVAVTLPTFPVVLNGVTIEQQHNQYPFLVYHNITYVPMTYYDAQLLGLTTAWDASSGLYVSSQSFVDEQAIAQARYVPLRYSYYWTM